ncbi:MAG: MBL fold metallo-hydrolase [Proteobacteria bacterium]|nr:MBL fold metallo-hydrolase [Pseudomonadota bacterium]
MDRDFLVHFRGVRGSIPTPPRPHHIEDKIRRVLKMATSENIKDDKSIEDFLSTIPPHIKGLIGGNSTCLQLKVGGHNIFFDGGSGAFPMAQDLLKQEFGRCQGKAHWFITHTHHDHIMGLPMFGPLYIPGNQFTFLSPYDNLRERFIRNQHPELFPVNFTDLGSSIEFVCIADTPTYTIGDVTIRWLENDHPGRSFSYRVEYKGASMVFSTDAEYKDLDPRKLQPVIDFFSDADLLIFDAQYAFTESVQLKRDWGHSSSFVGIDLALDAGVKTLALFHHEPTFDDFKLVSNLDKAKVYLRQMGALDDLDIILAREDLKINL